MFMGFITAPIVTFIQSQSQTTNVQTQWNNVFYFTALFQVTGGIVFVLFGSAEHQNWEQMGSTTRENNRDEDYTKDQHDDSYMQQNPLISQLTYQPILVEANRNDVKPITIWPIRNISYSDFFVTSNNI